jgi:hypothetical protein
MRPKVFAVLLLVVIAGALIWRDRATPERVQVGVVRPLIGHWTTAQAGYADRYLEITPSEIVFGQGVEGEARHRIVGVWRVGRESRAIVYSVRYETNEGELELEVAVGRKHLRLPSLPKVIWRKST